MGWDLRAENFFKRETLQGTTLICKDYIYSEFHGRALMKWLKKQKQQNQEILSNCEKQHHIRIWHWVWIPALPLLTLWSWVYDLTFFLISVFFHPQNGITIVLTCWTIVIIKWDNACEAQTRGSTNLSSYDVMITSVLS